MIRKQRIFWIVLFAINYSCTTKEMKTTGSIERLDPALDSIIAPNAKAEIIAEGYIWTEGPLWLEKQQILIFSDIPNNAVNKWSEEKGAESYLIPAGYTGSTPRGGELGSNGLLLDGDGNLILCQHGDRRLAKMLAPLDAPKAEYETLADKFEGKRLNSPNDAVFRNGEYFFTDPPYGMEKQADDPLKELSFQGVYRRAVDGKLTLLIDSLTRPNGIAFSPDGKYLFVANSDSAKARWYRYDFNPTPESDGKVLSNGKILYDATSLTATEKGLPDGMKIDRSGNIFATGPGGVFIFNLEGTLLGKIKLEEPTSNCALSSDEKILYVTNNHNVLRVKMR